MEQPSTDPTIAAAISLWEPLAAFAWHQFNVNGRGVVLMNEHDLDDAAAKARSGACPDVADLALSYVCLRDVPPSDDFAPIIAEYDPNRQIALIVNTNAGDEQLYVLETSERHERPAPRECFEAQRRDQHD